MVAITTGRGRRKKNKLALFLFCVGWVSLTVFAAWWINVLAKTTPGRSSSSFLVREGRGGDDAKAPPMAIASGAAHATDGGENRATKKKKKKDRLLYVGEFGLGHRLSKLSAAYHLAKEVFQLGRLDHDWGACRIRKDNATTAAAAGAGAAGNNDAGGEVEAAAAALEKVDIFAHLFGTNQWDIQSSSTPAVLEAEGEELAGHPKTIMIRNDVTGYYAGQSYKNAQIPVPKPPPPGSSPTATGGGGGSAYPPVYKSWFQKMDDDLELFRRLLDAFRYNDEIEHFAKSVQWDDRPVVVGLHLRFGNGERAHFVDSGRGVASDLLQFVRDVIELICGKLLDRRVGSAMVEDNESGQQQQQQKQQPLLFLATDTAEWIPVVQAATRTYGVEAVVLEQPRLESGGGVSYTFDEGQKCLNFWKSAFVDMALLSRADIVIASSRSTFTQILPRCIAMERRSRKSISVNINGEENRMRQLFPWSYCEVVSDGKSMTCFEDRETWLFRHVPEKMKTFELMVDKANVSVEASGAVHKVMVHLPDVFDPPIRELQAVMNFLHKGSKQEAEGRQHEKNVVFTYGKRFDPKYRSNKKDKKPYAFQEEWTWSKTATRQ